jgi:hypothetical protein
MTPAQIGKVWTAAGLALLYYAMNSWLVSQGGSEVFGLKLVVASRVPAAVVAIPVCTFLLLIVSLVGLRYARLTGIAWHAKIPVVGFETLNTGSKDGRVYQAAMLFLLCILPFAAIAHFWDVMLSAKIVSTATPPAVIESIWHWTPVGQWNDPARICTIFRDKDLACEGNITIVPGIEPMAFAGLTFLAAAALIAFLGAVFVSKAQSSQDATRSYGP